MRKIRELKKELNDSIKPVVKNLTHASFSERRSGIKDRRKIHTYIRNDRRSGIADRRRRAKFKSLMMMSENDLRRIFNQKEYNK
jgi:hypothetical protein